MCDDTRLRSKTLAWYADPGRFALAADAQRAMISVMKLHDPDEQPDPGLRTQAYARPADDPLCGEAQWDAPVQGPSFDPIAETYGP